jgi:hypothetical protein
VPGQKRIHRSFRISPANSEVLEVYQKPFLAFSRFKSSSRRILKLLGSLHLHVKDWGSPANHIHASPEKTVHRTSVGHSTISPHHNTKLSRCIYSIHAFICDVLHFTAS